MRRVVAATVATASRRLAIPGVVLLLAAALVAVGVAASAGEDERPAAAPPVATAPTPTPAAPAPAPQPERRLVLVRRRDGAARVVGPQAAPQRRRRGLGRGLADEWLLRRSATAAGKAVDAAPAGYAFPLDAHVVDPRAYARVTGDPTFRRLRGGRVLLSASSARVRRSGAPTA